MLFNQSIKTWNQLKNSYNQLQNSYKSVKNQLCQLVLYVNITGPKFTYNWL